MPPVFIVVIRQQGEEPETFKHTFENPLAAQLFLQREIEGFQNIPITQSIEVASPDVLPLSRRCLVGRKGADREYWVHKIDFPVPISVYANLHRGLPNGPSGPYLPGLGVATGPTLTESI